MQKNNICNRGHERSSGVTALPAAGYKKKLTTCEPLFTLYIGTGIGKAARLVPNPLKTLENTCTAGQAERAKRVIGSWELDTDSALRDSRLIYTSFVVTRNDIDHARTI